MNELIAREMEKGYVKPESVYVPSQRETAKLYDLETKLHEAVRACAEEWLRLDERDLVKDFYKVGVPQTLFDLLLGYDRNAAHLAAIAYLEKEGYTVTRSKQ